jgi:diphthamide synthase subunit DPH2
MPREYTEEEIRYADATLKEVNRISTEIGSFLESRDVSVNDALRGLAMLIGTVTARTQINKVKALSLEDVIEFAKASYVEAVMEVLADAIRKNKEKDK